MSIKIVGINRTKIRMRKLVKESPEKLHMGLRDASKFLLRESRKLVPVDTGALKASGYTTRGGTKKKPEFVVGYTMPYAIYVHEDPYASHPIGQWKYLEQPWREYRKHMIWLVTRRFK